MKDFYNSYDKNIKPNEFLIALFLLLFLIFFPTPSLFFKLILTWVILFIIFRQITDSIGNACFISSGITLLLLLYKMINPYSLILEGYDNGEENKKSDDGEGEKNESLDDLVKTDDDEDSDIEDESGLESVSGPKVLDDDGEEITPEKLRKNALYNQEDIRNGQRDLYAINKGVRELKASLATLGPALKDSKQVLNLFKDFDLFKK
jgi:hypothetical protein